jgi:hypothetical protein
VEIRHALLEEALLGAGQQWGTSEIASGGTWVCGALVKNVSVFATRFRGLTLIG